MHRQRGDDRSRREPRRARPLPGVPGLGCASLIVVTLYTRAGCHLCDEARDGLLALREGGLEFDLREVDIESDERLHAAYLERIPVVEVGGSVVGELGYDEGSLRTALFSEL